MRPNLKARIAIGGGLAALAAGAVAGVGLASHPTASVPATIHARNAAAAQTPPVESPETSTSPAADPPGPANDQSGTDTPAATAPETAGPEADGVGGHADANGANVDHQFNGNE